MLELFAASQMGMPYVQMGFRIVLYISNLFSNDGFDFLPMNQYMRWELQSKLFSFGKNVFLPCQPAVKVNAYIFGIFSLWDMLSV